MSWYNPLSWGKKSDEDIKAMSTTAEHGYVTDLTQNAIRDAWGRPAPQAGNTQVGPAAQGQAAQIATGPQDQFRGMQMSQANSLLAQALGNQKGAGQLAAEQMTQRGIAGQGAMARSARGGNAALGGVMAARNAADITQAGAGQATQAALQDKANANAMLSQALGQGRGQDIGLATSQAGFGQQMNLANMDAQNQMASLQAQLNQGTSLANLQAQLQQTGMNDAQINAMLGQLLNMNISEMNAGVAAQGNNTGYFGGLLNAGGQIAGAALAASDKRLKKDITADDAAARRATESLQAYTYDYRDAKYGKGRQIGIMAQDLERAGLGHAVIDTPAGKMVHGAKLSTANTALLAALSKRVSALEGGK